MQVTVPISFLASILSIFIEEKSEPKFYLLKPRTYTLPTSKQILKMHFSTKTIFAFAAIILPLAVNGTPIQARSDCVAADNAPAGSQAQIDALRACKGFPTFTISVSDKI